MPCKFFLSQTYLGSPRSCRRVGYAQPQRSVDVTIPDSVETLLEQFDVIESSVLVPSWDFVWNATVEEGREKRLLSQPFTTKLDELAFEDTSSEIISLAESALKVCCTCNSPNAPVLKTLQMTLGTPNDIYDPESASQMLRSIGEDAVATATRNLLSRGVLSKLVRDPHKSKPGRLLKISEV